MASIVNMFYVSVTICASVIHGSNYVTVSQLIQNDGYPFESHEVLTDDGYYLDIFRIPSNRTGPKWPPVLVVHGLAGSAADFVLSGRGRALAYVLFEEGFDVWLLNSRGTVYSEKHSTLKPTDSEFWNYTWHEIGVYDVPNTIDYILELTGFDKLLHLGMSQGTTTFYVMLSERPEYNSKILAHVSYTPSAFVCHTTNALVIIASFPEYFGLNSRLIKDMGYFNFAPRGLLTDLIAAVCNCSGDICLVCKHIAYAIADVQQFQNIRYVDFRKFLQYTPAGASIKSLVHYMQSVNKCQFRHYEHPGFRNSKQYDLSNIKVPLFIFHGENDNLQSTENTMYLRSRLPIGFNETIIVKDYGHFDFISGYDAKERVYDKTIEIFKRIIV